jgi:hypothetical protein
MFSIFSSFFFSSFPFLFFLRCADVCESPVLRLYIHIQRGARDISAVTGHNNEKDLETLGGGFT